MRNKFTLLKDDKIYQTIFDKALELILVFDLNGALIRVNRLLRDFTGYSEDQCLGKHYSDLPFFLPKVRLLFDQCYKKKQNFIAENLYDDIDPFLSGITIYVYELSSEKIEPSQKQSLLKNLEEMVDQAILNTQTIAYNLKSKASNTFQRNYLFFLQNALPLPNQQRIFLKNSPNEKKKF